MQIKAVLVLSFMMVAQATKPKFVSPNAMTFEQAEIFCQQEAGRLAQPTSGQDTYFKDGETASTYYWFGAYLMPSGGPFWTNGTAISWQNWNGGTDEFTFPTGKRGMLLNSSTRKWFRANAVTCEYRALCEPINTHEELFN
ncbi:hypothetical protein HDE_00160 [Halotydeus destructor]|nr:hypothetical protein HDE_00160 [Halotydeus destructor]